MWQFSTTMFSWERHKHSFRKLRLKSEHESNDAELEQVLVKTAVVGLKS